MRSTYKASRLDLHGEWMKFLEGNLITRVYSSILGDLRKAQLWNKSVYIGIARKLLLVFKA